jgi:hypothetical protein
MSNTPSEPVLTDLSTVMQPVTEETPDDHAVLTDLSAVMQPVTEETPDDHAVLTDLSAVMQPTASNGNAMNAPAASSVDSEREAPPPSADLEEIDTEAVMAAYGEAMGIADSFDKQLDWDDVYVQPVTEMEHDEEMLDAEGNLIVEEAVDFNMIANIDEELEAQDEDERDSHRGLFRRQSAEPEPLPYIGDGPVPYVSPKAPVSKRFRHYIQTRWYPQWKYYDQRAIFNKARHISLQIFVALGSVSVPILIGINFVPTWIPALISGMVAAFTAIENVMKYGDNWRIFRSAAEGLNREKVLYEAMSGPYKATKAPFRMFVERCEDIIGEETGRYIERTEENENERAERMESDISSVGD